MKISNLSKLVLVLPIGKTLVLRPGQTELVDESLWASVSHRPHIEAMRLKGMISVSGSPAPAKTVPVPVEAQKAEPDPLRKFASLSPKRAATYASSSADLAELRKLYAVETRPGPHKALSDRIIDLEIEAEEKGE